MLRITALVSLLPLQAAAVPPVTDDTLLLLNENPGLEALMQDGRVVALYGVPIAVRDHQQQATVRDFVDDWLFDDSFNGKSGHKDALGVDDVDLVPDKFCTGQPRKKCSDDNDCSGAETCTKWIEI
jgi:hypothetical protein